MAKLGVREEHVYSLEGRNEEDISPLWKMLQILFYVCCVGLGFGLCYSFSNVMVTMRHNCLLYSKIAFYQVNNSAAHTFDIQLVKSEFKDRSCNLVTFVPILTTVLAAFFIVLFCISGRGGSGNDTIPDSWRLVIPVLIINFICFCTSLYLADIFHKGLKGFLAVIASYMKKNHIDLVNIGHLKLEGAEIGPALVKYLTMTKHVMWMLVCFWGLSFFWIFLRCIFIVDFQLVRTSIYVYPKTLPYFTKPVTIEDEPEVTDSSPSETLIRPSLKTIRQRNVSFAPDIEVKPSSKVILKSNDAFTGISSPNVPYSFRSKL